MKRLLIVEDELPARKRITHLMSELAPDFDVAGYCDSIDSAVTFLQRNPAPDLILLDIQLGDGLSFEIFNQVDVAVPVIFTTAYDEYVFRAFELNSIDYLMKPVRKEDLEKSLNKLRRLSDSMKPDVQLMQRLSGKDEPAYKQRFLVGAGAALVSVPTSSVAYFHSIEKSVFLVTSQGKSYAVDWSLDKLETMLSEKDFFRINRQMLVAFNSVSKIVVLSKSRIKVHLQPEYREEVLVSSARNHDFRLWLDR